VLTRLYEFDLALLGMVNEISGAIDNVEAAIGTEGLTTAIRSLTNVAGQLNELYQRRSDLILGQAESGASAAPPVPSTPTPASPASEIPAPESPLSGPPASEPPAQ
jgi:hypothetical protein